MSVSSSMSSSSGVPCWSLDCQFEAVGLRFEPRAEPMPAVAPESSSAVLGSRGGWSAGGRASGVRCCLGSLGSRSSDSCDWLLGAPREGPAPLVDWAPEERPLPAMPTDSLLSSPSTELSWRAVGSEPAATGCSARPSSGVGGAVGGSGVTRSGVALRATGAPPALATSSSSPSSAGPPGPGPRSATSASTAAEAARARSAASRRQLGTGSGRRTDSAVAR